MLRKIRLTNFQCHRRLEMEAGPLTVITGKTDAGKSAVIRALRWVLLNDLSGVSFITQGQSVCSVRVWFDDFWVERIRSTSKNIYRMKSKGEEVKEYKSFNNRVPEDIEKRLGLSSDNLQGQHDPIYWLSLPDTQAAELLNSIVNLDRIDRGLAKVSNNIQAENLSNRRLTEKLEEAEARLAAMPDWSPLEILGESADKLLRSLEKRPLGELADLIEKTRGAQQSAVLGPSLRELKGLVKAAEDIGRGLRTTESLEETIAGIEGVQALLLDCGRQLKGYKQQLSKIKVCKTCQRPL